MVAWETQTQMVGGEMQELRYSSKHADRLVAILMCAQERVNLNHKPSLHKFMD